MDKQWCQSEADHWGGGGGGGGLQKKKFRLNIFCSIFQTQSRGTYIVHHKSFWQAKKNNNKNRRSTTSESSFQLIIIQTKSSGGGDIWYYVPHLPNNEGTCPPVPPPPPDLRPCGQAPFINILQMLKPMYCTYAFEKEKCTILSKNNFE